MRNIPQLPGITGGVNCIWMNEWTDIQLFDALRDGHKDALSILYLRHHNYLMHYGLQIGADQILVEESIQELFTHLFESYDHFGEVRYVRAYLFKAFRRRVVAIMGYEKGRKDSENRWLDHVDMRFSINDFDNLHVDREKLQSVLVDALNKLPWRQREAVYLRYYNGLSTKEIADIMGAANQTVLNTLFQALKKLRKYDQLKSVVGYF